LEIDAIRAADSYRSAVTYLFVTPPHTFTFFLGQRQNALGMSRFCEVDFDGGRGCSHAAA
jgi:hypothetical protein